MHCAAVQARPPVFLRLHTPQDPDSLIKGHDPGLNILTSPAFPSLPPALKLPSCCSLPSRLEQQLRRFREGKEEGRGHGFGVWSHRKLADRECSAPWYFHRLDPATARLAQSAERKALNLVVVGSSPTVGASCLGALLHTHASQGNAGLRQQEDAFASRFQVPCTVARTPLAYIALDASRQDSLAEWSKALASGASPQGRGFEPHSCHSS